MYAASYPSGRVVKFGAGDSAHFGEEEVIAAGEILEDEGRPESFTKKFFGGTVIWGGIESADAKREGTVDDACGWQCVGIWIILVVERRCSTDEWREERGQRRLGSRHDNGLLVGSLVRLEALSERDGETQ